MITTAIIEGRSRTQVWVRIPELHPRRILTLPGALLPGEKGDTIRIETRSEIEATSTGWFALVVPA